MRAPRPAVVSVTLSSRSAGGIGSGYENRVPDSSVRMTRRPAGPRHAAGRDPPSSPDRSVRPRGTGVPGPRAGRLPGRVRPRDGGPGNATVPRTRSGAWTSPAGSRTGWFAHSYPPESVAP